MDKTIDAFRRSLREETLPLDAEAMMRFQIAQLQAGKYRWQAAIDAIYEWFRYAEDEENPLAYYLLGIANFQLGNLDLAIVNTEEALKIAGQPNQGWLQLLAAVYVQKLNYAKAARALEKLVINFPKKQYWVQLGLVYGAMDNYQEQLAVQQVAYQQGFLTEETDLRRLARSYLYADLPYPAARVLESGLADGSIESAAKSLELLANSWIAAREYEKSLPPLVEAATVSPDGNLFVRLGQVFLQRENWAGAAERLEDAREKGGLTNPGNVSLLLGIAYYNNNQLFLAKSSFIDAAEHEKTKEDAERWIDHIETETKSTS
jgi:tetratricopeptide (TPR) repeat protein